MKKLPAKKIISVIFGLSLLFSAWLIGPTVKAENLKDAFKMSDKVAANSGYRETDLNTVIGETIMTVLSLVGVLAVIFIIYAGFIWMTAAGNEQKAEKGKSILKRSVIGLIIILCAYAITYFIINMLGSQVSII